jgi:hypothetical protein
MPVDDVGVVDAWQSWRDPGLPCVFQGAGFILRTAVSSSDGADDVDGKGFESLWP